MENTVSKVIDLFNERSKENHNFYRYSRFGREVVSILIKRIEELEKENTALTRVNCQLAGKQKQLRKQLEEFSSSISGVEEYKKEVDEWKNVEGIWGYLEKEPCRFCRQLECVYFRADYSPTDLTTPQVVRCTKCGRDWIADSSAA